MDKGRGAGPISTNWLVLLSLSNLLFRHPIELLIVSLFGAGYISTAITDGPGCLMLRCPDPSCSAAIGLDMINKLANDDDKKKYNRYFIRSFVEDNRKVIPLTAPAILFCYLCALCVY